MSDTFRNPPRLERPEEGTTIVYLDGHLDLAFVNEYKDTCYGACSDKIVVLDMAVVEHVDSSGLGMLVQMLRKQQAHGAKLVLRSVRGRILEILKTTQLFKLFDIEFDGTSKDD